MDGGDLGGPMLEAVIQEIDSLEEEIKQLSRKISRIFMSTLRSSSAIDTR